MEFTKMHGAGNDFIIIDDFDRKIDDAGASKLAIAVCDRRMGIGADGMMIVVRAICGGDYGMRFYNSDGTVGEMCGNGARCIARYGHDRGLAGDTQRIETISGTVTGTRITDTQYRVRLNDPTVCDRRTAADGTICRYIELGCPGLPHGIFSWPEDTYPASAELRERMRAWRRDPAFPKGANVTAWRLIGTDELEAITFERGVEDFTLACGTGAGSLVSSLTLDGVVSGRDVRVHMPGGELRITVDIIDGKPVNIFLTGPTCTVCRGEIGGEILAAAGLE